MNVTGELTDEAQAQVHGLLDSLADGVLAGLQKRGVAPPMSPLFRPWNLVVVLDEEKVAIYFTQLQGGVADVRWLDRSGEIVPFAPGQVAAQMGAPVVVAGSCPRHALDDPQQADAAVAGMVDEHLGQLDRAMSIGRVGDLNGLQHLEPGLREFLKDHPNYDRNVFIMMRFLETDQMQAIHREIGEALGRRGYVGIRADDRDYTGELWTNIEVCMVGCRLGVAVFEDIEERDFNPNVSLELGYMLGRRKRCLILKERRLPELPADVIHRLYKPFDIFKIPETVEAEVGRWCDVDLGA
jgi:hypothetical protein